MKSLSFSVSLLLLVILPLVVLAGGVRGTMQGCEELVAMTVSRVVEDGSSHQAAAEEEGSCSSHGFIYRGGACPRSTEYDVSCWDLDNAKDTLLLAAANQQEEDNDEYAVYLVVSNVDDPSLVYYQAYVTPGEFFQIFAQDSTGSVDVDAVVDSVLPQVYNMTMYSSSIVGEDVAVNDEAKMLQTMLVQVPLCSRSLTNTEIEGPSTLDAVPLTSSVQVVFTSSEPYNDLWEEGEEEDDVHALGGGGYQAELVSLTDELWTLDSIQVAHSGEQDNDDSETFVGPASFAGRGDALVIPLGFLQPRSSSTQVITARVTSSRGQHCTIVQHTTPLLGETTKEATTTDY